MQDKGARLRKDLWGMQTVDSKERKELRRTTPTLRGNGRDVGARAPHPG